MSRLEAAGADFEGISAKASKMEHTLAGIPIVEQIHVHAPFSQFRTVSNAVENPVTSPSVGIANEFEEDVENLTEPVAPMEHTEEDICSICVVGPNCALFHL